jgi:TIR domain
MTDQTYDVFLSYRSIDRAMVEQIANWLREQGLTVWFDKWKLRPGLPWQEALEQALQCSKSIAVFVGQGNLGPWEIPEMRAALSEQVRRRCPVIPVLLPGSEAAPEIPMFLRGNQWVDLRIGWPNEGGVNLLWGITGKEPVVMTRASASTRAIDPPQVFITNKPVGNFGLLFNVVIAPALRQLNLTYLTLADCESKVSGDHLAEAMEEASLQSDIIIWNFDPEAPWIPVFLQSKPQADKHVIVLASRGMTVPEVLSYAQVVRYNSKSEAGVEKLKVELIDMLSAVLSPNKLGEARTLCRLKHYDAALIAASNHLFEVLRQCGVTELGYSYFREKPLRYYSLSELFKVLCRKRKLRLPNGVDWQLLVRLRNQAVHGNPGPAISEEICDWYIGIVESLELLNSDRLKR